MTARMEYVHEPAGIVAKWSGGPYVDLYRWGWGTGADPVPFDAINVWDYATDRPTIPRTLDALVSLVDDYWGHENGGDDAA